MHGAREIIAEPASLPVEDRIGIVDSLLRTLNAPGADTDQAWAAVARRRLDDLRSGRVEAVAADQVFSKVQERFSR